ncbi:unnamed protein product [Moneuplotes crassus]|uniref:Uncharacterized protein n=1 Tax=Euplotes crassus TaxID=5936 RepID=A0AAD1XQQ2_EUPCR|nr:unnamed protein product [Moneuplotes crassus]
MLKGSLKLRNNLTGLNKRGFASIPKSANIYRRKGLDVLYKCQIAGIMSKETYKELFIPIEEQEVYQNDPESIHNMILNNKKYHTECQFSIKDVQKETMKIVLVNNWPKMQHSSLSRQFEHLRSSYGEESLYLGISNQKEDQLARLIRTEEMFEKNRLILIPDDLLNFGFYFNLQKDERVVVVKNNNSLKIHKGFLHPRGFFMRTLFLCGFIGFSVVLAQQFELDSNPQLHMAMDWTEEKLFGKKE